MKMQDKIKKYIKMFESKKRDNGDEYIVFSDTATEELKNSVYEAHGNTLPMDWIFGQYNDILEKLDEYTINSLDDVEEYRSEIVDGLVDIYTSDLTAWLNLSNYFVEYLDQAVQELGATENILSQAQYLAIDEIYGYVVTLLENSEEE